MGCTWQPGSDDELARIAAGFGDEEDPAPEPPEGKQDGRSAGPADPAADRRPPAPRLDAQT